MGSKSSAGIQIGIAVMGAIAWQGAHVPAARAQALPASSAPTEAPETLAPPPAAPAPGAAPASPASNAMAIPTMSGPLVANPNPIAFNGGPLGNVYFNGALSGLGLFQSNPVPPDHQTRVDFSNALVSLQNTTGFFQFFVQGGLYSFPALGTPYLQSWKTTGDFFGPVPIAYAKLAPNDSLSIEVGKLPTLIGAEYGFTFQNMNIERGLLWNQEPIVSRGIQANYTIGPVALSASLNDGFYSDNYNWLTGAATWTVNKQNTLEVVGGGNLGHTDKNALPKSPYFNNNSDIVDLIYTYTNAPWTITPYLQYTHVPGSAFFGTPHDNSTVGAAILASYAINDNVSLAARGEYIASTGDSLSVNALYGPKSSAMSFTVTPTWQRGIWFARGDLSLVQAFGTTAGAAFGRDGSGTTQGRVMIEGGIVF